MKKMIFLFTLCCAFVVNALGDPHAGEVKSTVCAACHGAKGVSSNPEWPSLAGQNSVYFIKQLNDYKLGHSRVSTVMAPLAAGLNNQDSEDLAAYYASLPLPKGLTPKQYLDRGELLYRGGDFDKHITACIACHGPRGTGNAQAGFPVVSGQQAGYIVLQLQQFKDNKRRNDLNSIMRDISAQMSTDDMDSVAHYMAGLH